MTHYARAREGGHARSSSTSAKWSREARFQESLGGDRRFIKLRHVAPWLEERMKSVWVLNRDDLQSHAKKPKNRAAREQRQCDSPQGGKLHAATRRHLK